MSFTKQDVRPAHSLEDAEGKCLLTQFTQIRKWVIKRIQKRERKSERENWPSSEAGRAAVMTSEQITYMGSKEKSSSLHNKARERENCSSFLTGV